MARTYEDIMDLRAGSRRDSEIQGLPLGYISGGKLTLVEEDAGEHVDIDPLVANIKGKQVVQDATYTIVDGDFLHSRVAGCAYYVYLDEAGIFHVDALAPNYNSSHHADYHPQYNNYRCLGKFHIDDNNTIDYAFATAKVDELYISEYQLNDDSVSTDKIQASAITTTELLDDAVTAAKIINDAVEEDKIKNGAVSGDKIAVDAVTADKILAGSVTTAKLDAAAVTTAKIAVSVLQALFANVSDRLTVGAGGLVTQSYGDTAGYQECGLTDADKTLACGLSASTTYYYKVTVNGGSQTEYSITTSTAPTYGELLSLLESNHQDCAWHIVGTDLRCTSVTKGTGSSIALAAGITGTDLFASLTGFTSFDTAVDGTSTTLSTGAQRIIIDENELRLEEWNGTEWQTILRFGGDDELKWYLQARGLIKTGADISGFDFGDKIFSNGKFFDFEDDYKDQDDNDPWDTKNNLAFSADSKYGSRALTNATGKTGMLREDGALGITNNDFGIAGWHYKPPVADNELLLSIAKGGDSWTIRTSATDNNWHSVCWSPELSLFCAVSHTGSGNRVMTSPDGINWTTRSSAADNNWSSVCWNPDLGLFCAVAYTGTNDRVMTSSNGIDWTIRTSAAAEDWQSVCWSPELELFCAVANSGTGNRVMTSPDGINWTTRSSAADNSWRLLIILGVLYAGLPN